jgi:spectinomycin phosphotransferase
MLTEPVGLDPVVLVETLNQRWDLQVVSLEYLPRGFGSHHWLAADSSSGRWFVTVDDLRTGRIGARPPDEAFRTLDMAFRTAVLLRDEARLEFVVAPLADSSGSVLRRLGSHYAVSLFPFVRGDSAADGEFTSDHDRRRVLQLLGRLHRATAALPPGLTRREDFAIPNRDKLIDALAELEAPWQT